MDTTVMLVVTAVVALALIAWCYGAGWLGDKHKKKSLLRQAIHSEPFDADELEIASQYWLHIQADTPAGSVVDDTTWNDLDMDAIYEELRYTLSTAGDEVLYAALRDLSQPDDVLDERDKAITALAQDEESMACVRAMLYRMGKNPYHSAAAYLFHPSAKRPKPMALFIALAVVPLVLFVLGFFSPAFLIAWGGMFLVNAIVYILTGKKWMAEIASIRHIASVFKCADKLKDALPPSLARCRDELRAICKEMKPVSRWNALFAMQRQNTLDFITDYLRIMLQLDMLCLYRLSVFFEKHTDTLRRMYRLVGEIDVWQAVAAHRAELAVCCRPAFTADKRVTAAGLAHPLLKKPVRNDLDWTCCILITGSNASGKSTFTKAVAVNCILAQSIVTCTAERFCMPRARVMSSMALRDSLSSGESYFIVELKSLKRILDATDDTEPVLCFIDEILRGTNTVERIAASTALLRYIAQLNCLCMAATHDQELTKLLCDYEQMHFREELTPEGMRFPYKLLVGPSDTQNAIELLKQLQFPQSVTQSASGAVERFTQTHSWM